MAYPVSQSQFEQMVGEAIAKLPEQFRQAIERDVPVQILPRPPLQMLRDLDMEPDELLFGLYEGLPRTELAEDIERVPDRIWLFKEDLEQISESAEHLREEVRITLLHELGHYFGLDEDDLERLGFQ